MHYTIRRGDTLSKIAAAHGTSLQALLDPPVSASGGRGQRRSVPRLCDTRDARPSGSTGSIVTLAAPWLLL